MASAADDALSALAEGLQQASTTLQHILALFEARAARECLAATRLQAATRGLLARRRMQSLEKSGRERFAAVRLQAAARGFLARHATRKLRAAIQPTLLAPEPWMVTPEPPALASPSWGG